MTATTHAQRHRTASPRALLLSAMAVGIGAISGCSDDGYEETALLGVPAAASPGADTPRVTGFEDVADWTTSSALHKQASSLATQGAQSLAVSGTGWGEFTSRPIAITALASEIRLDVRKSADLSGGWQGSIGLALSCPKHNLYHTWIAGHQLADLPTGAFTTVSFPVPQQVAAMLADGCDNLTVHLQFNLVAATDPVRVDNLVLTAEDPHAACREVYPGHNDPADPMRYNLVFVTRGFGSEAERLSALKRIIDLDGTERLEGTTGLMGIEPLSGLKDKFNFFYVVSDVPTPITDGFAALAEWRERSAVCQQILPNQVYPFLLQPNLGPDTYWVASWGCHGAGLGDCRTTHFCQVGDLQGAVHEMMHTIFDLPDEYEAYSGQPSKIFDPASDTLTWVQQQLLYPTTSYEDCVRNAPWAPYIGDGCGNDGVIDCIDTTRCPLPLAGDWENNWTNIPLCCKPEHPDCYAEIACFEGGAYYSTGLWRPTADNLMRNHWWEGYRPDTYLNLLQQDLVLNAVLNGPHSIPRPCPPL